MATGLRMLFPTAHEAEIEITQIIGCNYKVNFRALGGGPKSCFGNGGASLGQTRLAKLAEESSPHLCPHTFSWWGKSSSVTPLHPTPQQAGILLPFCR